LGERGGKPAKATQVGGPMGGSKRSQRGTKDEPEWDREVGNEGREDGAEGQE